MGRRGRGGGAGERVGEARAARAGRRPGEVVEGDAEVEGGVGKRDREESAAATARERTAREGRWEAIGRGRGGAAAASRQRGGTVRGRAGLKEDARRRNGSARGTIIDHRCPNVQPGPTLH